MLYNYNIGEILFLDIETVAQHPTYNDLDDTTKKLWDEKSRFMRERREISEAESYGEAGIHAEFGKIVCISVGYFTDQNGMREFRTTSFFGHDENILLNDFSSMMDRYLNKPFKFLCAHNGKEFDFPYICRRLLINGIQLPKLLDIAGKKPWEIAHLDTMELWKFGDYKHYTSLKLLAHVFGIPTPKDDIDGSEVNGVYHIENNLSRIEIYCRKDVITIARLFLAYRGESSKEGLEVDHTEYALI